MGRILIGVIIGIILVIWLLASCVGVICCATAAGKCSRPLPMRERS